MVASSLNDLKIKKNAAKKEALEFIDETNLKIIKNAANYLGDDITEANADELEQGWETAGQLNRIKTLLHEDIGGPSMFFANVFTEPGNVSENVKNALLTIATDEPLKESEKANISNELIEDLDTLKKDYRKAKNYYETERNTNSLLSASRAHKKYKEAEAALDALNKSHSQKDLLNNILNKGKVTDSDLKALLVF